MSSTRVPEPDDRDRPDALFSDVLPADVTEGPLDPFVTDVMSPAPDLPDPYMTDVVTTDELEALTRMSVQVVPVTVVAPEGSVAEIARRSRRTTRLFSRRGASAPDAVTDLLPAPSVALPTPAAPGDAVDEPPVSDASERAADALATAERLAAAETSESGRVLSELDARSISAWFGDHQVLLDVSLTMPAGQVTALIGPSGCGKSTFLRILNRMHELVPSASLAGEVRLDGDDIYDPGHRLIDARKHIGMVFQKPNPFPAMSIYDNVIAGLKLTGLRASRDEKDHLVETSLASAGLWKEVKDRLRAPGGGLSGGQQQRLCIARSLAIKPKVLLMDEPCSALDPTSTRVIEETMGQLQEELTIVIVTHNMQQAQRVSQQCAFFLASQGQPGHIVEHGDTEAMFDSPIDPRTYDYVNGRFG